jgi:hypothetical protein
MADGKGVLFIFIFSSGGHVSGGCANSLPSSRPGCAVDVLVTAQLPSSSSNPFTLGWN